MTSEPLFSCSQEGCREECSYPADMLALHNGEPICEDCYCDLPFKSKSPDPHDEEETLIWHDLPRFVPSFARRIEALEAALREVFEEWAGSEGFIPETAPEGYLLQLTKRMADIARAALGVK